MECPKCKATMEKGYIPMFKQQGYWSPLTNKLTMFTAVVPDDRLQLTEPHFFKPGAIVSYYCDSCRFIISEVPKYNYKNGNRIGVPVKEEKLEAEPDEYAIDKDLY
ncbi:MAG: PF20097 family protein [Candidatus Izemoplasma sp.]